MTSSGNMVNVHGRLIRNRLQIKYGTLPAYNMKKLQYNHDGQRKRFAWHEFIAACFVGIYFAVSYA
ncbi:hypothetical protein [Prevotella sp. OH937_COT-195]|uniref:hypothetical protein n=1 Tax=Prevotella sp. OH937_COT-195 TaxID=2491051 RepID=UPI000F64B4D4|nr:hypothetical protein [Prevotella sp. OH937_COT-195]RRD02330.1 hypothetical protein EII32_03700 [Prevotella sp. OH937_COT-195]